VKPEEDRIKELKNLKEQQRMANQKTIIVLI